MIAPKKVLRTFTDIVVVVQLLSRARLFATPWTVACQVSLSFTISWSFLKLVSTESVIPSNRLVFCHPLLLLPSRFPSNRVFSNESALHIRWPSIGVSASASIPPMNIQGRSPLGLTGWISLQSKGLSRVFSNTKLKSINSLMLSLLCGPTLDHRDRIFTKMIFKEISSTQTGKTTMTFYLCSLSFILV